MINRRRIIPAAIAALAVLALPLSAQTAQPQLVSVALVTVKPDRIAEWLDVEKQYSEAYKKGGGAFRYIYRNVAGNPYEFMVVADVGKYANLDDKTPYVKGTTEDELARMLARRNQCAQSVRTTYERTIPELAIPAAAGSVRKLMRVTRINVNSGMDDQFLALLKNEYVPALKKAGVTGMLLRRVEWGGSRNRFTMQGRLEKFENLDAGSQLTKALGAEGAAKLLAKMRQLYSSAEYVLYNYVPGSSYQPPPSQ